MTDRRRELAVGSQIRVLIDTILEKLSAMRTDADNARRETAKKTSAKTKNELRKLSFMGELEKLAGIVGEDVVLEGLSIAETGGVELMWPSDEVERENMKVEMNDEPVDETSNLVSASCSSEQFTETPDLFADTSPLNLSKAPKCETQSSAGETTQDLYLDYEPLKWRPLVYFEVAVSRNSQRTLSICESADFCVCDVFRTRLSAGRLPFCRHCVAVWIANAFGWAVRSPTKPVTISLASRMAGQKAHSFY